MTTRERARQGPLSLGDLRFQAPRSIYLASDVRCMGSANETPLKLKTRCSPNSTRFNYEDSHGTMAEDSQKIEDPPESPQASGLK